MKFILPPSHFLPCHRIHRLSLALLDRAKATEPEDEETKERRKMLEELSGAK